MSRSEEIPGRGHLAYYKQHGISPVRYDIRDLQAHLDRRDSLYRGLGLPPVAFKGCYVLEVAPGSGENSLYIASTLPTRYELVEPNPRAVADIERLYQTFLRPHTRPVLHAKQFEDFAPEHRYDIVICENWLSALPSERLLMRKLAALLRPGGTLVVTITPPTGFLPNVIRRLLALRIIDRSMPFKAQVEYLTEIFGSHLRTIKSMTRSHSDWVQDCLLNPHYLDIVLPLEVVLQDISSATEVMSSMPRIMTDWRWFKSLTEGERRFNEVFHARYLENLHNFFDYRHSHAPRTPEKNLLLERLCEELLAAARAWQALGNSPDHRNDACHERILQILDKLADEFGAVDPDFHAALAEARDLWTMPRIDPRRIADMAHFGALFGRETVYLSLVARA